MITHPQMIQGSDEWHAARRGRPTASRFKDIIAPGTGSISRNKKGDGFSDKVYSYIAELIGESFCPEWIDFAGNKFTDRGTELEPLARKAFEKHTGEKVTEVGFVTRKDGVVGCSPDGLICLAGSPVGGVELKCPSPKVHVSWIMEGVLPDEHRAQVHGSLAVTGLPYWHFFSFYPGLQPFHLVVTRDDYTDRISTALDEFLAEYGRIRSSIIPKIQIQK
jgi:hypothetical protein